MLQTVDGREVFVVDFDTMPTLPITWNTPDEKPYAMALVDAIQEGVIIEPGKYGIVIDVPIAGHNITYIIFKIIE